MESLFAVFNYRKKKVGDPKEASVFMGAVNSSAHLSKIRGCIAQAIADGGKVCCGETVEELNLPEKNKNVNVS